MRRTYLVRPTHYLKRCSERACRRTAQFALDRARRAARHAAHAPRGFGMRVMKNIIAGQLRGEVRSDWRDHGLTCEIALLIA